VLKNKTVQSVQANQCNQAGLQIYRSLVPKLRKEAVSTAKVIWKKKHAAWQLCVVNCKNVVDAVIM
jgi:hypothetical protein